MAPLVFERTSVKNGLVLAAIGIGGIAAALLGDGDEIGWLILVICGLAMVAWGTGYILSGPTAIRIAAGTVHLTEQRFWWSRPHTREWPLSEFTSIRVNYSTNTDDDMHTTFHYFISLAQKSGNTIRVDAKKLVKEKETLEYVFIASYIFGLPIEWAKKENASLHEDYERRPPHRDE